MKQRGIAIALLIGCVVLGIFAFILSTIQDKEAPVITVSDQEITYTEGDGYAGLLAAAKAEDNRDKDLSDKIFVDKIIDMGNGTAAVWYAVLDKDNNVGAAKKIVTYIKGDGSSTGNPEQGAVPEETPAQEDGTHGEAVEPVQPVQEELVPNGASPAVRLTANSAEIAAGSGFDALAYVENAVDDVDDRDTLFQHIHVDGEYYTDIPGTYTLNYYVTDSSGNASNIEVFTLTVK